MDKQPQFRRNEDCLSTALVHGTDWIRHFFKGKGPMLA